MQLVGGRSCSGIRKISAARSTCAFAPQHSRNRLEHEPPVAQCMYGH